MKKETVKEILEKLRKKLRIRKEEAVPVIMAVAALAAIAGLAVHAYRTEMFDAGSVIAAQKEADDKKEEPGGANRTRAEKADKTENNPVSITDASAKESEKTEDDKENKEESKAADNKNDKDEKKSRSDENTAAQIGSSEKEDKKTASGTGKDASAPAPAAVTPALPASPSITEQPEEPVSVPVQQPVVQTSSPVQESAPAAQPSANPQPVQEVAASAPEPVHEHSWVPVTVTIHHDAVTHTVHHDAVTQTVHHDAVTHEEPVYEFRTVCNSCGADITGHIPDHIGPVCQGSYSAQQIQTGVNVVTDQEAYDEEVVVKEAWDETVTDQAAYDDVVTTGYRCSTCGVMQQ